jgi:Thioredoxin
VNASAGSRSAVEAEGEYVAVIREQFEAGMSYDEYKAQMTRNREQFERNEQNLELPADDLAVFKSLPRPLRVLALAEDWCGDVVANLPILGRLAKESGRLDVRVLLRDQEPGTQVMDQYLNQGQFRSIPVFVFLDEGFNELGVWIERPKSVTRLRAERMSELYAQHPGWGPQSTPIAELPEDIRLQVQQATQRMRQETAPFANREVVRELRELVTRVAARVA